MKHSAQILRSAAVAAICYWGLAASCLWPGPVPKKGGEHDEPRTCHAGGNNAWSSAQLADSNIAPQCNYTVFAANQTLNFHFYVAGPNSSFFAGSNFLFMNIYDVYHHLNSSGGASFVSNPNNSLQQRADVTGLMVGGIATPPTLPLDSADFTTSVTAGNAEGWLTVPGRVDNSSSTVIGPNATLLGRSNSWRASPYWDTSMYAFQWQMNGTNISGATGAQYSATWNSPGIFPLRAIVYRTSGSSDTVNYPVSNTFTVSLNGPTKVTPPGGSCTWSAVANGGGGTVAYQWTWDGAAVGSGASFNQDVSGSPHTLGISLTDSYSNHASTSRTITIGTGGTACVQ